MKYHTLVALAVVFVAGCQTESATEPTVETVVETTVEAEPVAFNVSNAPIAELHVPDMMCVKSCAAKVQELLAAQEGVKDVKIEFEERKAVVAVDEVQFDGEAAVAVLVDYSFPNTKLIASEQN